MLVLGRVALELSKHLLWVLEVFPRALGADIDAAERVGCPAVQASVEEVVWVGIVDLLGSIVALAIEPVLRLETAAQLPASQVVVHLESGEEGNRDELSGLAPCMLTNIP